MKIKIFSDFLDPEKFKDLVEKICETEIMPNYGKYKDYYITSDDDYTHAIIINKEMPELNIPKKNVIGLAFEPVEFLYLTQDFINYAQHNIGKYFIGDKLNLPEPFIEHYAYMTYIKPPLNYIPIKIKKMSFIFSKKMSAPGHGYRHMLVNSILNSNLPIDIYGRGCEFYSQYKDPRIKGEFTEENIKICYENYKYHICIENFQSNHYISEKLINPLIYGTIPIYLGCKQYDYYFPNMIIPLNNNVKLDMQLLTHIFNEGIEKKIDIEFVKNKVNFVKNIISLFNN